MKLVYCFGEVLCGVTVSTCFFVLHFIVWIKLVDCPNKYYLKTINQSHQRLEPLILKDIFANVLALELCTSVLKQKCTPLFTYRDRFVIPKVASFKDASLMTCYNHTDTSEQFECTSYACILVKNLHYFNPFACFVLCMHIESSFESLDFLSMHTLNCISKLIVALD